ncbi:MAG: cell division protein ZipA [Proteobacteria bacterium]|nr:cell division protein ZipA [Pseudomonadota bacterium]
MFSMRFLLLLVGVLFVFGVYVWGRTKSKRNTRIKFQPRRTRFQPSRRAATRSEEIEPDEDFSEDEFSEDNWEIGDVVTHAEPFLVTETVITELPTIKRERDETRAPVARSAKIDAQLELTFEELSAEEKRAAPSKAVERDDAIIALFVRPSKGHQFAGPEILKAMNNVGLRFGDMDIFHHFGAGDLRVEQPLFSAANMVEPGAFDMRNIDRFTTPGLALFLRLPGPLDGAVSFELFLNTGQRLAEALSGGLYGEPNQLLDAFMIDKMRRIALPFSHGK